jgi:DNA polymerase-4
LPEQYSPTLVPISIDEDFQDFSTMGEHVWCDPSPEKYVKEICARVRGEVGLSVSTGLANSLRLAKLATDAAKPGSIESQPGEEKGFLKDRSAREFCGIGKNRKR